MNLAPGTLLHDRDRAAPPIRIEGFLASGRSFDIARGTDSADGRSVVLKAIRYPEGASDEARKLRHLRSALEADILRRGIPGLPGRGRLVFPVDDNDVLLPEPIVAMEEVEGTLLPDWLLRNHPDGLPAEEALTILRPIVDTLSQLHEEKLIFRALAPEHVLMPAEGRAILLGTGNIGERSAAVEPVKSYVHERFSAPEILRERSGVFVTPRADVYSVGLLLAWLCTGQPPSGTPDEPVGDAVWKRLLDHPLGIRLLVAHCTQPFHKKRMARLSRMLPLLHPDHLPTRETEGFGEVWLLAPWSGAEAAGPAMTPLSPGPLVGRKATPAAAAAPAASGPEEREGGQGAASEGEPMGAEAGESEAALPAGDAGHPGKKEAGTTQPAEESADSQTAEPGAAGAVRAGGAEPGAVGLPEAPWEESPRARALRIGFSVVLVVAALVLGGMRLFGG